LAPEANGDASAPEAASSSARPIVATSDWRTAPSTRLFSTICTYARSPDFLRRKNMAALRVTAESESSL
jgi:hypothetical protein